jgi:hypothetical protein
MSFVVFPELEVYSLAICPRVGGLAGSFEYVNFTESRFKSKEVQQGSGIVGVAPVNPV